MLCSFGDISDIIFDMCASKMSRPNVKNALKLPEYAMAPARLLQDICRWECERFRGVTCIDLRMELKCFFAADI